ncbi:hypothetical protein BaRGS_00018551 [Batillaria attramentaria]|uniref:Ribosome receptor lysine/proline rich domain-containing protein n=1 Tax=Batillaria attramentaria TaxID=370345 RepID=A0ABD0KT35_9CAEN
MDPQTILIGVTAFVVSALLIYLISAFTMREKTFEEVMAEQKRRQEEERERAKQDKKIEKEQYKKKFKKGKPDKSKEKAAQVSEPELKDSPKAREPEIKEHKMVNLEIDPEIIEPSDQVVLGGKPKSKSKSKKSILHNKDEVTPVAEKAPELPHKPITPRDEIELKKLHEKDSSHSLVTPAEPVSKKDSKGSRQEVKEVRTQKLKATHVETMEVQQSAPVEVPEKKHKSKSSAVDGAGSESRLIDTVRTAHLNEREVQTLIEILLNRQGAAATPESWNKKSQKGDPMSLMKKQLEEKERALQEEQQLAMSANNRVKELRNELTVERTKLVTMEKHFQEKLALQAADLEALQARMRHAHEQHMIEVSEMRARMQQLEQAGDAALVQKLKQENKILQDSLSKAAKESVPMSEVNNLRQKVAIMEKELASNAVKLNASESSKKSLEDKLHKYEEQIRKLDSAQKGSEDVLSKKVEEVSGELRKAEAKNAALTKDLNNAHVGLRSSEKEVHTMKQKLRELEQHLSSGDSNKEMGAKLQEAERKKVEMEGNVRNLERQLADSLAQQEQLSAQLQELRQENHALAEEMKTTKERQQGEGQEAPSPAPNGDIHKEGTDKNVIQIQEHERILSEKMAELTQLQKELEVQRSTTAKLQASAGEVKDLREQLEAQKKKNNELREKNWKAMEALEKAEKSASEKVDKTLKSSRDTLNKAVSEVESLDKSVMQRLFPEITISDKLGHKEWVAAFEKQAAQHLSKASSSQKNYGDKLSHLEAENSRLQADVEVFKNNIAILHSEKDRIKELEEENRKLTQQAEAYEKNFSQANADQERLLHIEEENQRLKASLSQSSSSAEELSRLKEEKRQLESRVEEYKNIVSESERKLQDLEQSVETEEKKWKEKLRQAQESAPKSVDSSSREQELEELTIQQQSQIEEYRNVLASTEAMLRQLESKAESEEKKWEGKLQQVQKDLQESKAECQRVEREMQSQGGSSEMQSKVERLERELRESNERITVLTSEKQELTSKVIVLESETRAVAQVDTEDLRKQLEELQRQLEAERKKNKELSSTLVRLNGIIKTGQDALAQEQKLVQQLQEQLADKSKGTGASANQELEQGFYEDGQLITDFQFQDKIADSFHHTYYHTLPPSRGDCHKPSPHGLPHTTTRHSDELFVHKPFVFYSSTT